MTDPVPIKSRQPPLGMFRATSCRDAASLGRDGEPFYAINDCDTADGQRLVEIQFGDGTWMLADPTRDIFST